MRRCCRHKTRHFIDPCHELSQWRRSLSHCRTGTDPFINCPTGNSPFHKYWNQSFSQLSPVPFPAVTLAFYHCQSLAATAPASAAASPPSAAPPKIIWVMIMPLLAGMQEEVGGRARMHGLHACVLGGHRQAPAQPCTCIDMAPFWEFLGLPPAWFSVGAARWGPGHIRAARSRVWTPLRRPARHCPQGGGLDETSIVQRGCRQWFGLLCSCTRPWPSF